MHAPNMQKQQQLIKKKKKKGSKQYYPSKNPTAPTMQQFPHIVHT
jgi:hypothetical protein